MMSGYTLIDWRVKKGKEQEFVEKWKQIAAANTAQFNPNGSVRLLRDDQHPTHFISLGEWPNVHTIQQWWASDGFRERLGQARDLVDEMNAHTLTEAAAV
jgi:heme-degrading monooxygenase HmoA